MNNADVSDCRAPGNPLISVTFFRNAAARSLSTKELTLEELAQKINETSASEKSELPWCKLALFGDRKSERKSLRHDENVRAISGIELDYDGKQIAFDSAVEALRQANLTALVYTSPSHQASAPKWRVLCPTSRQMPPGERAGLVARLNGVLGGVAANESFTLSQSFFYGSVNHNPDHRVEIVHGDHIDLRDDLDEDAIWPARSEGGGEGNPFLREAANQSFKPPLDIAGALADMQHGNVHETQLCVSASLMSAGVEVEDALAMILEATKALPDTDGWDWGEEEHRVRGMCSDAVAKYGAAPPAVSLRDATSGRGAEGEGEGVNLEDFCAYMPSHSYVFTPSREFWPASSVDARLDRVIVRDEKGRPVLDERGRPKKIKASTWLDQNSSVEQMTWAPGQPMLIPDKLVSDGGFVHRPGVTVLNLYRPAAIRLGDAGEAQRWLDHVHRVYPDNADHIIRWLAHRTQRPGEKINHALVLGGDQGIGKDTMLEPVKRAIGPWNFIEASPQQILGRFNGFVKSVILRISEARDLGGENRFQFYEHTKVYTAAPPDVIRVDEKNLREHNVLNCCGVILTTNRKDSLYLPADDRRHYVAWSGLSKEDFTADYWKDLWRWYGEGGDRHVAAYLAKLDLAEFDPKAPPPKTDVFWQIVEANRTTENTEFSAVLDQMGNPLAVTLTQLAEAARSAPEGPTAAFDGDFYAWLVDRKNRRQIPHRMEDAGYVPVRNVTRRDGLWLVEGAPQVIYARKELSVREQHAAASELVRTAAERARQ